MVLRMVVRSNRNRNLSALGIALGLAMIVLGFAFDWINCTATELSSFVGPYRPDSMGAPWHVEPTLQDMEQCRRYSQLRKQEKI